MQARCDVHGFQRKRLVLVDLTLMGSLFKAVIDLLEHGLAATLEYREHNALEGIFVGCLDGALHGLSCCSTNSICSILQRNTELRGRCDLNVLYGLSSCLWFAQDTGFTIQQDILDEYEQMKKNYGCIY